MELLPFGIVDLWFKINGDDRYSLAYGFGVQDIEWYDIILFSGLFDNRGFVNITSNWEALLNLRIKFETF